MALFSFFSVVCAVLALPSLSIVLEIDVAPLASLRLFFSCNERGVPPSHVDLLKLGNDFVITCINLRGRTKYKVLFYLYLKSTYKVKTLVKLPYNPGKYFTLYTFIFITKKFNKIE